MAPYFTIGTDLAIDEGGWSSFPLVEPSAEGVSANPSGSRVIYVDPLSGNNYPTGIGTKANPLKSLYEASTYIRNRKPDHIRLRNGTTIIGSANGAYVAQNVDWGVPPTDANDITTCQPVVFEYYKADADPTNGTRPKIYSDNDAVFSTGRTALPIQKQYYAAIGLELKAYKRDPFDVGNFTLPARSGITAVGGVDYLGLIFFEDCKIHWYALGLTWGSGTWEQGFWEDYGYSRRNILCDAWDVGGNHRQNLDTFGVMKANHVSETLLDRGGWCEELCKLVTATLNSSNSTVSVSSGNYIYDNQIHVHFHDLPGGTGLEDASANGDGNAQDYCVKNRSAGGLRAAVTFEVSRVPDLLAFYGDLTSGSAVVTNVTNVNNTLDGKSPLFAGGYDVEIGEGVTGTGIQTSTTIQSILENTVLNDHSIVSITLNKTATVTQRVQLTGHAASVPITASGSCNIRWVDAAKTVFDRNCYFGYIHDTTEVMVDFIGNHDYRSSSEGAQFRAGGTVKYNSWWFNPGCLLDRGEYSYNICLGAADVLPHQDSSGMGGRRGLGILCSLNGVAYPGGVTWNLHDNIFAHNKSTALSWGEGIQLDATETNSTFLVQNNICFDQWGWLIEWVTPPNRTVTNNYVDLAGSNVSNSTPAGHPYSAPARDLGTYAAAIGVGSTADDYIAFLRARPQRAWDIRYSALGPINHVRTGFDLAAIPPVSGGSGPTPTGSIVFGAYVLDNGLVALSGATQMYICSTQPTTYTEATSTYALGSKTTTPIFGSPTATTLGRKVVASSALSGGAVSIGLTANATHWAAVDATNFLASGPFTTVLSVSPGQSWSVTSFDVAFING